MRLIEEQDHNYTISKGLWPKEDFITCGSAEEFYLGRITILDIQHYKQYVILRVKVNNSEIENNLPPTWLESYRYNPSFKTIFSNDRLYKNLDVLFKLSNDEFLILTDGWIYLQDHNETYNS